jgi:3-deoxy-D-manno-octulosonate 8-phosphate phosphatase (KDO 8-P phosphatase)
MSDLQNSLQQVSFIVTDVDGVLTDGRMWFDGEGRPFRYLFARDGTGLTLWHLSGGKSAIVTGLGSKALETIKQQWRCDEIYMWVKDKGRVCREIARKYGIGPEQMAFVADDLIDLPGMEAVGLPVAVADAVPVVKQAARLVLKSAGGQGALRELVETILTAQGRLDEAIEKYTTRKDHPI